VEEIGAIARSLVREALAHPQQLLRHAVALEHHDERGVPGDAVGRAGQEVGHRVASVVMVAIMACAPDRVHTAVSMDATTAPPPMLDRPGATCRRRRPNGSRSVSPGTRSARSAAGTVAVRRSITSSALTAPQLTSAVVFDTSARFLAIGLYDPPPPPRASRSTQGSRATIDTLAWGVGLDAPSRARALGEQGDTTGYRVVQRSRTTGSAVWCSTANASTLVLKSNSAAWPAWLATLVPLIADRLSPNASYYD